jgi:hypothetical protein
MWGLGKVDVIVVSRGRSLTRALADSAKLVELFDNHNVFFCLGDQQLKHHHVDGPASPTPRHTTGAMSVVCI